MRHLDGGQRREVGMGGDDRMKRRVTMTLTLGLDNPYAAVRLLQCIGTHPGTWPDDMRQIIIGASLQAATITDHEIGTAE